MLINPRNVLHVSDKIRKTEYFFILNMFEVILFYISGLFCIILCFVLVSLVFFKYIYIVFLSKKNLYDIMKRKKKKESRIYLILLGTFLDQLTAFFIRKNIYHMGNWIKLSISHVS